MDTFSREKLSISKISQVILLFKKKCEKMEKEKSGKIQGSQRNKWISWWEILRNLKWEKIQVILWWIFIHKNPHKIPLLKALIKFHLKSKTSWCQARPPSFPKPRRQRKTVKSSKRPKMKPTLSMILSATVKLTSSPNSPLNRF